MQTKKLRVLLFNGSPHKEGCTYTALKEIADTLEKEGIEPDTAQIVSDAHTTLKG